MNLAALAFDSAFVLGGASAYHWKRPRQPTICGHHRDGGRGFRTVYGYRMHMRNEHGVRTKGMGPKLLRRGRR